MLGATLPPLASIEWGPINTSADEFETLAALHHLTWGAGLVTDGDPLTAHINAATWAFETVSLAGWYVLSRMEGPDRTFMFVCRDNALRRWLEREGQAVFVRYEGDPYTNVIDGHEGWRYTTAVELNALNAALSLAFASEDNGH